eukprot:6119973-Prymnesium_polylepis.1
MHGPLGLEGPCPPRQRCTTAAMMTLLTSIAQTSASCKSSKPSENAASREVSIHERSDSPNQGSE